jgi:hypothetical protein
MSWVTVTMPAVSMSSTNVLRQSTAPSTARVAAISAAVVSRPSSAPQRSGSRMIPAAIANPSRARSLGSPVTTGNAVPIR